jgi:hypothetical protein
VGRAINTLERWQLVISNTREQVKTVTKRQKETDQMATTQTAAVKVTGPIFTSGYVNWCGPLGVPQTLRVITGWDSRWFAEYPYNGRTSGRNNATGIYGLGQSTSIITFDWSVDVLKQEWTVTPVWGSAGVTNNLWAPGQGFLGIHGGDISNGITVQPGSDVYFEVLRIA